MIEGTIIKNGDLKLVLTGTDEIDIAVLKQLNGMSCTLITDNLRVGDRSVTNGLIIELKKEKQQTNDTP